jgi:hypothetical protein
VVAEPFFGEEEDDDHGTARTAAAQRKTVSMELAKPPGRGGPAAGRGG